MNDETILYAPGGAEMIRGAIAEAKAAGKTVAEITGDWEIAETVLLPPHTTLVLRDCRLRMAAGTFCNMFRNEHAAEPDVVDEDIHIRGIGRAVLDGGEYNGLCERNSLKDGRPHISVNNLLLFGGVRGFSVTGIRAVRQRWWALNFIACADGLLRDIDFESDPTRIDKETGEKKYGLRRSGYEEVYIKNSDGIDLRCGCHDVLIENVTGFTEDDTVALTALTGYSERTYAHPAVGGNEIYNVTVRNVRSSAFCANVRLLNQGGTKLYNIVVDGVFDTSMNDPRMDRGGHAVRLGDAHLYGTTHSTGEETFNIVIRNVFSRAPEALNLWGEVRGLTVENIHGFDGNKVLIADHHTEG